MKGARKGAFGLISDLGRNALLNIGRAGQQIQGPEQRQPRCLVAGSKVPVSGAVQPQLIARQSDVARASLDAEITYSSEEGPSKPIPGKRKKLQRADRPGRPKTFGSRSR